MRLVVIDFETYYDKDYSLSKMTTEEYVNDPRFQIIGFGAQDEDGRKVWITGSDARIDEKIRQLQWDNVGLIAHNTRFDGAILAWKFGLRPMMWFDTYSMARPFHNANIGLSLAKLAEHYNLGRKGTEVVDARGKRREDFSLSELAAYGEYCKNDCELTWGLFEVLHAKLPPKELKLIDLTLRMFLYPKLRLDPDLLEREIALDQQRKEALFNKLSSLNLGSKSLTSNNRFAELLGSLGVEPPTKTSLKTGEKTWAFSKADADFMALLQHDDSLVVAAVEARLGSKSTQKQTRATRFLGIHHRMNGLLPVPLGYYNAHTGRYGGEEKTNLQNLQRTDPKGDRDVGLLRRAIITASNESLLVADYSQIEARMLVWVAQQRDKIQAFADGRDVYSEQATVIFGRTIDRKKNPADFIPGFIGKAVVLGCGYGLGYLKFAGMIHVGMLGMKGILFDDKYIDDLAVDASRWAVKKQLRAEEWERILLHRPILLTEDQWIKHCAVSERIIHSFRDSNPRIVELWKTSEKVLEAMLCDDEFEFGGPTKKLLHTQKKSIILPNGMALRYEGLDYDVKSGEYSFLRRKEGRIQRVKTYGGSVTENIIQALSRIPTTDLMLKMDDMGMAVVLQAHDEVGAVIPDEDAELALEWTLTQMKKSPKWAPGLPLSAEGGISKSYGEVKK